MRNMTIVGVVIVLAVLGGLYAFQETALVVSEPEAVDAPPPPEHEEIRYPAHFEHEVEIPDMAFVKFDNNRLSTVCSFDLELKNLDQFELYHADLNMDQASVSAHLGGATCSVRPCGWAWYTHTGERIEDGGCSEGLDDADAFAAGWVDDTDPGIGDELDVVIYEVKSSVGTNESVEYWVTGDDGIGSYYGPTGNSWSGTLTVNNAVAKGEVTDASYNWRESPRSFRDRSSEWKWYADGQTTYTATLGDTSATGDATWEDEEIPVLGYVARVQFGISYDDAPELDTSYAEVNNICFSVADVEAALDEVHYYSTNGSDWTYYASDPGGQTWHAFGDGAGLRVHRIGGSSGDQSWGLDIRPKGPIRVNLLADRFGDLEDYPHDNLPRFDVGIYNQYADGSPNETVWFNPGLSEWYLATYWSLPGDVMPNVDRLRIPNTLYCKVDRDWLEENDELLEKTIEYNLNGRAVEITIDNVDVPIAIPSITAEWETDNPYWAGAITVLHSDVSVDIPPGQTERPTLWQGNAEVSTNEDSDEWTVQADAEDPAVYRNLATRYWTRLDRMASKPEPEENLNTDWPIQQTANENTDDDEPEWIEEVPVEDVTNWDNSCICKLLFDDAPEAADGQEIMLELSGREITLINDDFYTCHEYRFGEYSDWYYETTNFTVTYTGTIVKTPEALRWGGVQWDLALPDDEENIPLLQHVDTVRIYLPATDGTYTLYDMELIEDSSLHGYDEYKHLVGQAAIDAWNWEEDYCGFGATYEGKPICNLEYGMDDKTEVQKAMKQHQERYHCPTSSVQTDICYAKQLSRLADELDWQEQLNATYNTTTVETHTKDEDDNSLGVLYWWDLERGEGDTVVDENGNISAAMQVSNMTINAVRGLPMTMNCRYHLHGRGHGIMRTSSERVRSTGGGSDDETQYADYIVFWKRDDGETEWTAIGSCKPDETGRYKTPPAVENEDIEYAISEGMDAEQNSFGQFATREYAEFPFLVPAAGRANIGAVWQPVTKAVLITDIGLASPSSAGHRILRTKAAGSTPRWSDRYPVPDSSDVQWGNIICTASQEAFVESGDDTHTRFAASLNGDWWDAEDIETGYACAYGIESQRGPLYITAYSGGKQYLLRREKARPYAALNDPVEIGSSDKVSAGLVQHKSYWSLVAALQNGTSVTLYRSDDEGRSWSEVRTVSDMTYPYLCANRDYTWLLGYSGGSLYVTRYLNRDDDLPERMGRTEVGQADEGRSAIHIRRHTSDLYVFAVKDSDWGQGAATPGIAEYISTDMGRSWTLHEIHEVGTA